MLQLLSAMFGFAAPFLPQLLKYFEAKRDNEHELRMLEMRLKHAAAEHEWRMEEITAQADIAEMQTLRQPQASFGVQLIDAAERWAASPWGRWLITPAFYLFVVLDFLAGMVRPAITYSVVAFYMAVKYALYSAAAAGDQTWQSILPGLWTENDFAVLTLVLSFWFGARTAKSVFGGSASTGKPGAG